MHGQHMHVYIYMYKSVWELKFLRSSYMYTKNLVLYGKTTFLHMAFTLYICL